MAIDLAKVCKFLTNAKYVRIIIFRAEFRQKVSLHCKIHFHEWQFQCGIIVTSTVDPMNTFLKQFWQLEIVKIADQELKLMNLVISRLVIDQNQSQFTFEASKNWI